MTTPSDNEAQSPPEFFQLAWGMTRRYRRLVKDGDKTAIQIEIDETDERRLEVLLCKASSAVYCVEQEVHQMKDSDITKFLEDSKKQHMTVTPAPTDER